MTIAFADGTTHANELDLLLSKDMPSREETQGKMPAVEQPKRLAEPNTYVPNEEDQLSNPIAPDVKQQNDPYSYGLGSALDGTGPAKVPYPTPKFHEIMGQFDEIVNPQQIPANAQPIQKTLSYDEYKRLNSDTGEQKPDQLLEAFKMVKDWAGEKANALVPYITQLEKEAPGPITSKEQTPKEPNAFSKPTKEDETEAYIKSLKPSGLGETYDNFNAGLIRLADKLQPDFVPTPEQFKNASWREQVGWMVGTTMMMAAPTRGKSVTGEVLPSRQALDFWKEGLSEYDKVNHPVINTLKTAEKAGSEVAGRLLETYNKIDDPMVKMEFGRMVSNRLSQATRMAEEGVPGGDKFKNPEIYNKGPDVPKGESFWSETIVNKEGTKETVYDKTKLGRLEDMVNAGKTFQEIADKFGISRGAVASAVRRFVKDPNAKPITSSNQLRDAVVEEDKATASSTKQSSDALLERLRAEGQAKPFTPNGAVNAPETGGGSGGPPTEYGPHNPNQFAHMTPEEASTARANYEKDLIGQYGLKGKRNAKTLMFEMMTDAEYKKHGDYTARIYEYLGSDYQAGAKFPIDSQETPAQRSTEIRGIDYKAETFVPTRERKGANDNRSLQIDDPVMEATIDKTWENFGRANRDNLPLISPAIESKLQEINPVGLKKLKQFELEMDYKYKQPQGRRHWLSDLTEAEADRYRKLYNDIDKVRPVK